MQYYQNNKNQTVEYYDSIKLKAYDTVLYQSVGIKAVSHYRVHRSLRQEIGTDFKSTLFIEIYYMFQEKNISRQWPTTKAMIMCLANSKWEMKYK